MKEIQSPPEDSDSSLSKSLDTKYQRSIFKDKGSELIINPYLKTNELLSTSANIFFKYKVSYKIPLLFLFVSDVIKIVCRKLKIKELVLQH